MRGPLWWAQQDRDVSRGPQCALLKTPGTRGRASKGLDRGPSRTTDPANPEMQIQIHFILSPFILVSIAVREQNFSDALSRTKLPLIDGIMVTWGERREKGKEANS